MVILSSFPVMDLVQAILFKKKKKNFFFFFFLPNCKGLLTNIWPMRYEGKSSWRGGALNSNSRAGKVSLLVMNRISM